MSGTAPAVPAVERQRTVLRAPRVEFDLSALALGAFGYFAYQWTWPALASLLQVPDSGPAKAWQGLRAEFFTRLVGATRLPFTEYIPWLAGNDGFVPVAGAKPGEFQMYSLNQQVWHDLPFWKIAVVGAWLLVLWSVIAGAISRVYAVRIARDESIGAADGVAFSLANLRSFIQAPLFVGAAAALFFGLAALAGAVSAVPAAGPFLAIVAYPLALLAGLVLTVIAVGGIFGFPLMQAALATERNGTLDAISRTFSYVFTRPVAYLVSVVMVTIVARVVLGFGNAFLHISASAVQWGASWNADATAPIDAARAIWGGYGVAMSPGGLLSVPDVSKIDGLAAVWVYVTWAFTALAALAVNGYVLSYFVGGLTDTYFMLRREVDGIDDSEVYVEGVEAKLDGPLPGEPKPADQSP